MKNFFYLYIFIWLVAVFALVYFKEGGFALTYFITGFFGLSIFDDGEDKNYL